MPTAPYTLPSITINDQASLDRVLAAFNSDPAFYKSWLSREIKNFVALYENYQSMANKQADVNSMPF